MFKVWREKNNKCWRAGYPDSHGVDRTYTLQHFPKTEPKEKVLAEVGADAAKEYVAFLQREGLWSRLQIRNYDIKRMYQRIRDYHAFYSIEEFAYDLDQFGIKPVDAPAATKRKQKEKRAVKSLVRRNKKYAYRGRELSLRDWSPILGIPAKTLNMRISRGWDLQRAFNTPVMTQSEGGQIGADRRWRKAVR